MASTEVPCFDLSVAAIAGGSPDGEQSGVRCRSLRRQDPPLAFVTQARKRNPLNGVLAARSTGRARAGGMIVGTPSGSEDAAEGGRLRAVVTIAIAK